MQKEMNRTEYHMGIQWRRFFVAGSWMWVGCVEGRQRWRHECKCGDGPSFYCESCLYR